MHKMLEEHIVEFGDMLDENSSVLVLRRNLLEGDDLMAGYVQMHPNDRNIVISGDKDMIQLLRYHDVAVIDPATGTPRTLSDWNGNVDIFMFEKCIRGEGKAGDNIQSSYPRLPRKKIFSAFEDDYVKENIMKHTFTQLEEISNGEFDNVKYNTSELFHENEILMDLTKQPRAIKLLIVKYINKAKNNNCKYNHFAFLRYCNDNELIVITKRVRDFVTMLSV
jgi:hypothetical protein